MHVQPVWGFFVYYAALLANLTTSTFLAYVCIYASSLRRWTVSTSLSGVLAGSDGTSQEDSVAANGVAVVVVVHGCAKGGIVCMG
jgi:hypothetical protein